MDGELKYFVSGCAPQLYPTDTFFGLLWYSEDAALEIPKRYPYQGEWGEPLSTVMLDRESFPVPRVLDIVWLSLVEKCFYTLYKRLPVREMTELLSKTIESTGEALYTHIVVGMAPFGGVALWLNGNDKTSLLMWEHAEPSDVPMSEYLPTNPDVSLDEVCNYYVQEDDEVRENLELNGLPAPDMFDKYMQQFTYKYVVVFAVWNKKKQEWEDAGEDAMAPDIDYFAETLYDGTKDKLNDGSLFRYHQAGKPFSEVD